MKSSATPTGKSATVTPRMLDEEAAAVYCGCSRSWLRQLRQRGSSGRTPAPAYVKLGRRVLYDRADLDRWLDAHRVVR
jgi:predicted DNA-binding transcriptional regulator AlpA